MDTFVPAGKKTHTFRLHVKKCHEHMKKSILFKIHNVKEKYYITCSKKVKKNELVFSFETS